MSFLSDLFHGDFGNLGHDLTAHFSEDLPWYLGGAAALTGGLGLAGIGPAAGLFGGAAGEGGALAGGAGALIGDDPAMIGLAGAGGAAGGGGAAAGAGGGLLSSVSLPSWVTSNIGGLAGAGVAGAGLLMQGLRPSTVPGSENLTALAGQSQAQQQQLLQQIQQQQQQQQQQAAQQAQQAQQAYEQQQADIRARIDPIRQSLIDQYNQFISPLSSGQLPSGAEQALQNAKKDATTAIKSRYAQLGISGSSAEADALANVENQITSQRFSIAQNMAQQANTAVNQALTALSQETSADVNLLTQKYGTLGNLLAQSGVAGTTATGQAIQADASINSLQQQIFSQLMQQTIAQDKDLQSAIGNFAGALGKIGGTQAGTYKLSPA